MARYTILCVLALAVASWAAPADEAVQVPENTHVTGQINVKPGSLTLQSIPIPSAQVTVQDKQQQSSQQEQQAQQVQVQQEQQLQQEQQEAAVQQEQGQVPLLPLAPALAEVQGAEASPDLLEGAEASDGDKSDLDTANTWGFGWRRRGWGGGWGGYYRPYYGGYYGGHRGWGNGWGRGYGGGWGGYYW